MTEKEEKSIEIEEELPSDEIIDPKETMKKELTGDTTEEEEKLMTRKEWHEYVLNKMRKEDERAFKYVQDLYGRSVEQCKRRKDLTLRIIDKIQEYYADELLKLRKQREVVEGLKYKPDVDLEKFLKKNSPGYVSAKDKKAMKLLEEMKKRKAKKMEEEKKEEEKKEEEK